MLEQSIQRRDFLKAMGFGTLILGTGLTTSKVLAKTDNGQIIESEEMYGKFAVEEFLNDKFPYQFDVEKIKMMSEKYTIFSRNYWDEERQNRPEKSENITHQNLIEGKGKIPNQTRLDYALMSAAWTMARRGGRLAYGWESRHRNSNNEPWEPADLDMNWLDTSQAVKHAAKFYGASAAGITKLNPLWIYSDHFTYDEQDKEKTIPVFSEGERFEQTEKAWYIPKSMNRVVVLLFEEYYYGIANSPGRLASAATGDGYSRMAFTSWELAEFFRELGYRALPAGNGVGLSIPMAVDAGLGELGRMGLLISPKYGPRVRIAKVITDMPLVSDSPIRFGVTEFCEVCKLCADQCPSAAVSKEGRTWKGQSHSNNPGVYKWYTEGAKCYDFNGFSCSNCKRVCPYTKPNNSWLHQMSRKIIEGNFGVLGKMMVTLDQASGYGVQLQDTEFWKMNGSKTIAGRDWK